MSGGDGGACSCFAGPCGSDHQQRVVDNEAPLAFVARTMYDGKIGLPEWLGKKYNRYLRPLYLPDSNFLPPSDHHPSSPECGGRFVRTRGDLNGEWFHDRDSHLFFLGSTFWSLSMTNTRSSVFSLRKSLD